MKKLFFTLFVFTSFALGAEAQETNAQEGNDLAAETAADTEVAGDSIAVDTIVADPDPEWYVAPISYDFVVARFKAPRRAAAANCPIDSVRTFNVNSMLESVTVYEYGDTTRTMVWTVKPDGSRYGSSRTEEGTNGNITFSATYDWDAVAGDWKGTSKEEHYFVAGKDTAWLVYAWVDNAWVVDTKYTYVYDGSGRETEFTTYERNASGQLAYSKQRIREYNTAGKTTLDIQYTAHNGTDWSAGTKRIYNYDGNNNTILNEYYSAYTNGAWVGSSKEIWAYTSGKMTYYEKNTWSNGDWVSSYRENWTYTAGNKTYYEKNTWSNNAWVGTTKEIWAYFNDNAKKQSLYKKYGWANGDWAISQCDSSVYDAAGNNTLIENYTYTNGAAKGTKKITYTYDSSNRQVGNVTYKWTNNAWEESAWTVTGYDEAGNKNMTCQYKWKDGAWVGSGYCTLTTFNGSKKPLEVINQVWSSETANWVNYTRNTTVYEGSKTTQEATYTWSTEANDWVGNTRSDWHYNAKDQNDTIKTYTNNGTVWIYSDRTAKTYNAAGTEIMVHNAHWSGSAWVMTSMTRKDISDVTEGGVRQTLNASWKCNADSVWIGVQKDSISYNASGEILYNIHCEGWANNDWLPSYKVEIVYDEYGHKILNHKYNWSNSQWVGVYRYEYSYDNAGKPIMQSQYIWSNNDWYGFSKTEWTYYASGDQQSSISFAWINNGWQPNQKTEYIYDNQGRTIDRKIYQYADNTWKNNQWLTKIYDDNNREISNREYRWVNSVWFMISRNDLTYDLIDNKLRREVVGSWSSSGALNSYYDNHYFYACDPKLAFTIRFENEDGTLLESKEVQSGTVPTYDGETPKKGGNEQYSYTFKDWDKAIAAATGDATYVATYDSVVNTYLITFMNGDVTLQSTEVEYGTTPSYTGGTPTKPATAEYTYTFTGWDAELAAVTGEATYSATFSSTKNQYTITWLNDDDSQIDQTQVEYGIVPTHDAPTKQGTAEYTYTFTGWDKTVVAVTGNATYKATFSSTKNKYTITWLNDDDSQIDQTQVEYGIMPTHDDPTKANTAEYTYTFTGWDKTVVAVTGDATYKATFSSTKNQYTITWLNDDDSQIDQTQVEYGIVPTHDDPTKAATAEYTYTFDGWDKTVVAVTGDATYKATFSSTKNQYTITWLNDDDSQIDQTQVEYGIVPTHDDPTKQGTAEYTYTFTGWDKTVVAVTGDATYKATFSASKNQYTVTWLYDDGLQIDQTQVEYGIVPTHDDPTKPATAEYTFTFTGWNKEITAVTGDATYTAIFDSVVNTYTIIFYYEDGVTEMERVTVEYGQIPATTVIPSIPGDAQYTYEFAGWSPQVQPATGEATYTATFTAVPRTYAITFKNYNGVLLQTIQVAYGEVPVYSGETPTKPMTAKYSYIFSGWTPELTEVTGEATYTAVFESTVNTYTIIFYDEDGTVLAEVEEEYGKLPTYPYETPTKADDEEYTYTFVGWTPKLKTVTGDASYTATYKATKKGEGVEIINGDLSPMPVKVLINGTFYILRDGKTYTLDGALVE